MEPNQQQQAYASQAPAMAAGGVPPTAAQQYSYSSSHHLLQAQAQQLQAFWNYQRREAEQASAADFKNHQLPLARIKKIMKADEDVRMISAEAPVLFAKACELFILELTTRAWLHAEENKRRTLQRNDVAAAVARTDVFDFLVDIVPRDEPSKDAAGSADSSLGFSETGGAAAGTPLGGAVAGVPYFYPPLGQSAMMPPWHVPSWDTVAWTQQDQDAEGDEGAYGGDGHGLELGQGYRVTGIPPPPPPPPPSAPSTD